ERPRHGRVDVARHHGPPALVVPAPGLHVLDRVCPIPPGLRRPARTLAALSDHPRTPSTRMTLRLAMARTGHRKHRPFGADGAMWQTRPRLLGSSSRTAVAGEPREGGDVADMTKSGGVGGPGVNLSKGQAISLEKEDGGGLSAVRMGLGWQAAKRRGLFGSRTREIDLDASAVLFADKQPL